MEEQNSTENWRDEVSDNEQAPLKILDGEEKTFVFIGEGEPFTHAEYGKSIVFTVKMGEEELRWYVNPSNFALLKQIKALGTLKGKSAKVKRTGAKKSDTRYTLEEVK